MRFSHIISAVVHEQIENAARDLKSWQDQPPVTEQEIQHIREGIQQFSHTVSRGNLRIGGVDGSGDFPCVSYNDSYVYFATAQGTVYQSDALTGLKEVGSVPEPVVRVTVLHEAEDARMAAYDETFECLAGSSLRGVISRSDYRRLKAEATGRATTVDDLVLKLIRPHAADSANIGVQLRSSAELGAALRLIRVDSGAAYVLSDGTMSLPLLTNPEMSLFHEHLKRLCCVEALDRAVAFVSLSKSHGLPSVDIIEDAARESLGLSGGIVADHWYMRLPIPGKDSWELSIASGRRLPPPGAVTYLVRFFRSTPVMRMDMDVEYWKRYVRAETEEATRANERRIFEDLDYASHDQRCYGYPYPIKAGHDRASMTKAERAALRKMIIDAAVKQGVKRSAFRQPSIETGHE